MATKRNGGTYARKEEDELENAYRKMAGSNSRSRKNTKINRTAPVIIICIALIAIVIGIVAGYLYFRNAELNGIILDNVSVAGINVGGMTQAQAIAAVEDSVKLTYKKTPMVVTVLDSTAEIPVSCIGKIDVEGAVKAAYKFGNSGSAEKKKQEQQIAMTVGYTVDLTPYLDLDTDAVKQILSIVGADYSSTLSQSTYEVTGTAPSQTLVIQLGVPEYGLDLDALYNQILRAYSNCEFQVEGVCGMIEPEPVDLKGILDQYYVEPVDASFDPETYEIIEGINGYGFDLAAATEKLNGAQYGSSLEIPFTVIEPAITAQTLSAMLYRDELATYTSTAESDKARDTNLELACKAINEQVILPGKMFSFNDVVGEPLASNGYLEVQENVGTETVMTVGGGLCQISSSLYYCAMVADLEILERKHHELAVDYVPLGMDAAVMWGEFDFRFRNNTDYPIRIEATASGGNVTITFIGTDTKDYYVELEYDVLNTYNYDLTYQVLSDDNIDGFVDGDYIVEPHTGYDVKTYRCKYDKQTGDLLSRDLEADNTYESRNGIICQIKETTTPDPEDDTASPGFGNGVITDESGMLPPE